MVRFSEIQQSRIFLETSPGNFRIMCPRYEIFGVFGEWKALTFPGFLYRITSDQHFSCFFVAPGTHVTAAGQDLPDGVEKCVG